MSVILMSQSRPSGTSAETLVSGKGVVSYLAVANVGGSAGTCRVFHSDATPTATYDESTALFWDIPVAAQETVMLELPAPIHLDKTRSVIGVRTSIASNLTFSAYGRW